MPSSSPPIHAALPWSPDPQRGFLPLDDPLRRLPDGFDAWEEVAAILPKYLAAGVARDVLNALPALDVDALHEDVQARRAMMLLSYFGHSYVWAAAENVADHIPANLAVPWYNVASRLGRPPVLSYASYALDNWYRLDASRPVELGNIALLQNFLGGMDEEWFILVHVEIEAKAGPALRAIVTAQEAAMRDDVDNMATALRIIAETTDAMCATLARMPQRCDPYVYYHRVRPYIHGWKDHPLLPNGVVYEGVDDYEGKPQRFRGETGAQSGIVPALDAGLGIGHADDPLRPYLMEMRTYMPPDHRVWIETVEGGPRVRDYVRAHHTRHASLKEHYNAAVHALASFRSLHFEYAATYIYRQALADPSNPTHVGTGGTPFMAYLQKHRDETLKHKL